MPEFRSTYVSQDPGKALGFVSLGEIIDGVCADLCHVERHTINAGTGEWTSAVMDRLAKRGIDFGFHICASRTEISHWGESGTDMSWRDYGRPDRVRGDKDAPDFSENDALRSIVLALECEWGVLWQVEEDFEKLLSTRALLKVMVCEARAKTDQNAILNALRRMIWTYTDTRSDDMFLTAIYTNDGFVFHTISGDNHLIEISNQKAVP